VLQTVATGLEAGAIAFDNIHNKIWVSNYGANTVSKILGGTAVSYNLPSGSGPAELAFDGASMWVACYNKNNVVKVSVSTGAVSAPISTGANSGPTGIAYDGTNMWVCLYNSNAVVKISPAGVLSPLIPLGNNHPVGIAFDGANMWVCITEVTLLPSFLQVVQSPVLSLSQLHPVLLLLMVPTCGSHITLRQKFPKLRQLVL